MNVSHFPYSEGRAVMLQVSTPLAVLKINRHYLQENPYSKSTHC